MLDEVCQPALARPLLLDEAAFVSQEQAYARFVSLPREDRIAYTVRKTPTNYRRPINFLCSVRFYSGCRGTMPVARMYGGPAGG